MKGLEIARDYFAEFGKPMLEEKFPELMPYLAAGFTGSGSECFGYDDEISRDHDFEPGFCLFLPDETIVNRRSAFLLERAYAALPGEYEGLKRSLMGPVGGARRGVLRTDEYYRDRIGVEKPGEDLTVTQWLSVPEYALAEAVNGELFFDNYGEVTRIREKLAYYPEDVRLKKLAGNLLMMAQSGQYNYMRCIRHREGAAAQLAVGEFARSAISTVFLLNHTYQPYYKWSFRALRSLPVLSLTAELLEYLLTTDNDKSMYEEKYAVIESIAADVIDELTDQGLTKANCGDLEKHAYSVNDMIANGQLRNMHILAAV
ncbi:MAG: DUF4037 domain-containing protein [Lachnospiraceae bacterium]|nr:DUF4037 domain-containing protein [Lachnospiraceae bacterium]